MKLQLRVAREKDLVGIHEMQVQSFSALLVKYQDVNTNPALETLEDITERFHRSIMSNTAVSNMLMPISVGLAAGIGVAPYGIMAVVALASSCAFMLPISTPPNAAVFSTNELKIEDMVKAGFWINIASIIVIVLAVYFLQPILLNF